ncbi:MAG: hypothetical protein Q7T73_05820 [Beijerinckiaceae bacterium]|nr:hypothetical protein [Beijerinckiaceae bacterium]
MIALPRDGQNGLRLVLLGLAALIFVLLGWRGPDRGPISRPAALAKIIPDISLSLGGDARPAVEISLTQAGEYAPVLDRMRRDFGTDYERVIEEFAERASSEGRIESVDYYLAEMIRGLRQRRGILAARASPAPLSRIFEIQAQMLTALSKTNPKLCVDFLYGNVSPDFYAFAASNRRLVADMALAAMNAVADGRRQKVERRAPSNIDFDLLEKELTSRGLSRPEIDALLDGRAPERPPGDVRMCEAGRKYIDALQSIPEGSRARIQALAVELMARS